MKRFDKVYLPKLNADGVIMEAGNADSYRVAVGDLIVSVHASEIQPPRPPKKTKLPKKKLKTEKKLPTAEAKALSRLDLHGMRVEEAMSVVNSHISRAIMAGVEKVEVIHGIGTGKIKEALHKYLSELSAVEHFRPDPANQGVTWVYF